MKRWQYGVLAGLFSVFVGCQTMMPPDPTVVSFQSTPAGAAVAVNGVSLGHTPLAQRLSCQHRQEVTFTLPGYQDYQQTIPTVPGWDRWGLTQWPVELCAPVVSVVLARTQGSR